MFRKLATGLLLVSGIALFAPQSMAEDHTFNASICHTGVASVNVSQYGIGNSGPGGMSLTCPLVFDYAPGAALMSSALATVYDRNPNSDVSCTLIVTDLNGNTLFSANRTTNNAAGAAPINLRWASISPSSGAFGVLSCTLPTSTPAFGMSHLTTYSLH